MEKKFPINDWMQNLRSEEPTCRMIKAVQSTISVCRRWKNFKFCVAFYNLNRKHLVDCNSFKLKGQNVLKHLNQNLFLFTRNWPNWTNRRNELSHPKVLLNSYILQPVCVHTTRNSQNWYWTISLLNVFQKCFPHSVRLNTVTSHCLAVRRI